MGYGYTSDTEERRGFIDKSKILQYVTEEEIFSMVCGYIPKEFEYVTSPFRKDTKPGCWFERRGDTLRFIDFGRKNNYFPDCFDAVQRYFDLPNFYRTLEFIYDNLIAGHERVPLNDTPRQTHEDKEKVIIGITTRNFTKEDADFWMPYGISRQNLIDDNVFPVSTYSMKNTKKGDFITRVKEPCYAYTEFAESRKKLYFPKSPKEYRFITNCTQNDIGGIEHLPLYGEQLIISKAYKDYRVIKNYGRNVVWFQNEGMTPEDHLLFQLVKRFDRVIVLFDNDQTGQAEALSLSEKINEKYPRKSRPLWIPEKFRNESLTDPSDLRKAYGNQSVLDFFKNYLI